MKKTQHRSFGQHIRRLRRARGLTQELVAERSGLSADTIRRVETGHMSPSLDTLQALCRGFDLRLSTMFESFELGEVTRHAEVQALLDRRPDVEVELGLRMLRALFDALDGPQNDEDDGGSTKS